MTEFWMGVGMIAGAPVFGFVSALLAVAPIYWALGRVLKKMPEEDRAENKEKVDSIVASLVFAVFSLVALVSVIKGFCFMICFFIEIRRGNLCLQTGEEAPSCFLSSVK